LPVGAAKWANCQSSRLLHELIRSDGVPEPDRPIFVDGGTDGGGAAREGVGMVGGVMVFRMSDPWNWSRGPMEILAVWLVNGVCTRPVTTEI
jgi:hypothetical protein